MHVDFAVFGDSFLLIRAFPDKNPTEFSYFRHKLTANQVSATSDRGHQQVLLVSQIGTSMSVTME